MSKKVSEIVGFLNEYLRTDSIKDSSCNGLQVQGPETVTKIGLAVDACMASYQKAAAAGCDMLIVHHGLIWHGLTAIAGSKYKHVKFLLDNNINLYASHLPLDLHPLVGNNAQLAKLIGLTKVSGFGVYDGTVIGFKGSFAKPKTLSELSDILKKKLGSKCVALPFGPARIKTVGVVSGGAPNELEQAIDQKLDCYLTGEGAHQNHHQALEGRINVLYGGHYETETVGVKALGKLIEKKFGVKTVFLDVPTLI